MNVNNIPKSSGIYKLTNKVNGKIYIGKANNLHGRKLSLQTKMKMSISRTGLRLEFITIYDNSAIRQ